MITRKNITLIISLFIALNTANATPPEELTKKPSSAIRIARLKERALKLGRRLAGTKEYSPEEVQKTRAKTFVALTGTFLILFVGYHLNPFKLLVRDRGTKGGIPAPPPAPKPKKKKSRGEKPREEVDEHKDGTALGEARGKEEEPGDKEEENAPPPEGDKQKDRPDTLEGNGEEMEEPERTEEDTPPEAEEPRAPELQPGWWQPERWSEKEAPTTRAALVWLSFTEKKLKEFFGPAI